jgi:hypothetical protein
MDQQRCKSDHGSPHFEETLHMCVMSIHVNMQIECKTVRHRWYRPAVSPSVKCYCIGRPNEMFDGWCEPCDP